MDDIRFRHHREVRVLPRRYMIAVTIAAAAIAAAPRGYAAAGPDGPVEIIVPFAPGGSADIFARILSEGLATRLGQPVTINNRPGAGGSIGLQKLAQAAPDGRTLLVGQTGEIVIQPYLMNQPVARPDPVALVAVIPLAVAVSATGPYANLNDLIVAARSAPRGLAVASPGRLTPGDLAIELFRIRTGANLASVPFSGGGPALDAVAEGLVDFYFSTLTSAMPYVRAGKLKILAVTTAERSPALPDVPTVQQSGIRSFAVSQWAGIFVPRGTPGEIIARLNQDINEVLAEPEVNRKLVGDGARITPMSPAQFAGFIKSDGKIYEDFLTAELCSEFLVQSCSGGGIFTR